MGINTFGLLSCKIMFYKLKPAWFSAADCISVCYFTIINGAYSQCIIRLCYPKVLPRLELGPLDSKSKGITVCLVHRRYVLFYGLRGLCVGRVDQFDRFRCEAPGRIRFDFWSGLRFLYDIDESFKRITVECKFVRISCLFKLHKVGYIKILYNEYIIKQPSVNSFWSKST
jgi:hypothetical protein